MLIHLPELIEWHEGMLLTPQHFQELTARSELLTHLMYSCCAAYGWGVLDLKLDENALGSGVLRLLRVEAVLPDGLLVLAGAEHDAELVFDLNKITGARARIYLAAPSDSAVFQRSDYGRYQGVILGENLTADGVSEAAPVAIPRLRPRLKLVGDEADLVGTTSIPLVEFAKRGTVFTQTGYIPPLLRIGQGSPISDLCAKIRKHVRNKATELARNLSPGAKSADLAAVCELQWLVSSLPFLEAVLSSDQLHPFPLYLALVSLAGNVAYLSHARVPPVLTPYRHHELRASFEEVAGFIQLAMAEGFVDRWVRVEFTLTGSAERKAGTGQPVRELWYEIAPGIEAVLGAKTDLKAPYLGLMLRASAGMSTEALIDWGQSCLLATADMISDLEVSRSLGATCEWVSVLDDLVPDADSVLFRVKNDPRWIQPGKPLILKPARQEKRFPETATLFVPKQTVK
jgi:type VI secretion system protein ImpJ